MIQIVIVMLLLSVIPGADAAAQQAASAAKEAKFQSGTTKIKLGVVLLGAGALIVVADNSHTSILWGAKQRSDALRPQLTFGLTLRESKTLFVSRQW